MNDAIMSLINSFKSNESDGKSDSVEARLSEGEYVIPAEVVSKLGNGATSAGARILDTFVSNVTGTPPKNSEGAQEGTTDPSEEGNLLDKLNPDFSKQGEGRDLDPAIGNSYDELLRAILKERRSS